MLPFRVGGVESSCPTGEHCPVCFSQRQRELKARVLFLGQDGYHTDVSSPPSLPHLPVGSPGPGQPGRMVEPLSACAVDDDGGRGARHPPLSSPALAFV